MKRIFKSTFTLLLFHMGTAFFIRTNAQAIDSTNYDRELADSLGADEHGMKAYVFVILKTGPKKIKNKTIKDSLFRGHMYNIIKLANEGKLVVAGPFFKNKKEYRGLFILNVNSIEEANALLQTDPTIKAKLLVAEIFKWYGSAALPVYLNTHKKIEKKGF